MGRFQDKLTIGEKNVSNTSTKERRRTYIEDRMEIK